METQKRVTSETFEVDGRIFKLNAYDPMEGNYILTQVLSFVLPLGLGDLLVKHMGTGSEAAPAIPMVGAKKMMPKEDFMNLQKDILKTVEEVYPTGNTSPVLRENGTYGVADVTMGLLSKLLVRSLAFNFKDFFEDIPSIDGLNLL